MMIWWSSSPSAGASSIEFYVLTFLIGLLLRSISYKKCKSSGNKVKKKKINDGYDNDKTTWFTHSIFSLWVYLTNNVFFCDGVAFENDVMLILSFSHLPIAYIAQLQNLAAFIISNSLVEIAKDHKEFLYGTLLQFRENVYSLYLSLYRLCPQFSHPIHHTSWIKMTPVWLANADIIETCTSTMQNQTHKRSHVMSKKIW